MTCTVNRMPFMVNKNDNSIIIYNVLLKSNLTGLVVTNKGTTHLTSNLDFTINNTQYNVKDFSLYEV